MSTTTESRKCLMCNDHLMPILIEGFRPVITKLPVLKGSGNLVYGYIEMKLEAWSCVNDQCSWVTFFSVSKEKK